MSLMLRLAAAATRVAAAPALVVSLATGAAASSADAGSGRSADAAPSIFDLLPRDTMMVVLTDDATTLWNNINQTPLAKIMASEAMQTRWEDFSEEMFEAINETHGLDLSWEDLVWPQGAVGMGWVVEADEDEAGAAGDNELGPEEPPLRFLMMMDFGDQAADFEDLFTRIFDRMEDIDDDALETEQDEFEDRVIYTVRGLPPDREEAIADITELWGEAPSEEDLLWLEETGWFEADFESMHYVIDGSTFLASDSLRVMENAILRLQGDLEDSLTDSTDMQSLISFAGGRNGIYGAMQNPFVMAGDPMGLGAAEGGEFASEEEAEFAASMREQFRMLGLLDWMGMGFSMNFDTPDAMMETQIGMLMPGQPQGIFTLVATNPNGLTLPNWADPDLETFNQYTIDFGSILPLVRTMVGAFAGMSEDAEQTRTMFETQAAPILQMLLEVMGPNVYYGVWPDRVLKPEAVDEEPALDDEFNFMPEIPDNFVYAIDSSDPTIIENTLVQLTAAFPLFKPRDFLGFRIYQVDDEMLPLEADVAIGFGKQMVILGGTAAVERVLRATEDTPSLREVKGLDAALQELPDRGWMYAIMPAGPILQGVRDVLTGDFEAGMNPADAMASELTNMLPGWFDDEELPSVEEMRAFLGHLVVWGQQSDRGLNMTFRVLHPEASK